MYVNVGVRDNSTKKDIATKAALKRAIVENPDSVELYDTSEMSAKSSRTGANLDIAVKYSVTGPNPYTNRKWYATVEKLQNGKITVK